MLASIAWRNLWRSPRRTIILLLAVAGGLTGMLANYGLIRGTSDHMLEGITGSSLGHVQIHREGYRAQRGAHLTVRNASGVLDAVRSTDGVEAASGRIYGFAHAAFVRGDDDEVRGGGGQDVASPVTGLYGVDPTEESRVTDVATKVRQGRWIEAETDVVVGADLARRNGLEIGDAFLPSAVDSTGAMRGPWAVSDEVPRVVGIIRTGVEQIDGRMVILNGSYLARLLRMEDQVHEIAIRAEQPEGLDELAARIDASVERFRAASTSELEVARTAPLAITPAGAAPSSPDAAPAGALVRLVGVPAAASEEAAAAAGGIARGRYLARSDDIVLSEALASELGVSPGDRVDVAVPVDCGEGVAESECPPSSETFAVAGVLDGGDEVLDGSMALVSRQVVSGNVAALAPSVVSPLEGDERARAGALVVRALGEGGDGDEVLPWHALAPEIQEMLAMMEAAPIIFFMILYFAVMLGIVNSMLMATYERTREIGLMRAVGMRPGRVVAMVLSESALLSVIGVAVGVICGAAIVLNWTHNGLDLSEFVQEGESMSMSGISFDPVLYPRIALVDVIQTSLAVGVLTTLAGLWPAIRAARLQPTEALRHE